MATLTLRLFGTFALEKDGRPLSFGYDKMRALLAYLAVEQDRAHRRQMLAALFWPDDDKRAALGSLSQALYRIRRAVGEDAAGESLLTITPQTLQLNSAADIWIDVLEFTRLIDSTNQHEHTDRTICARCLAQLQRAVELHNGTFLAGISVDKSPDFDEWLLIVRERYQRLAGEVFEMLATGFEHREQHALAMDYARRRLELEPWHEETHRQIMRLHLAAGDHNAALSHYETCRHVLAAELAVDPSAETTALYERIGELQSGRTAVSSKNNLPTPLTPLIGRADELADLKARLAEPDCRLLSLVGPGGSGKTRLAIDAASQAGIRFADGITFVSLVSIDTVEAVAPALAQALGLSLTGQGDPHTQVIDYLRRREMLLLLDNFEHLVDAVPFVADLLRAAPQVKVLITSRSLLHAPAEQVIPLPGLAVPPIPSGMAREERSLLTDYGAVALFLYHMQRTEPGYIAEEPDLDAIVRICHLVAGMPLGIMLSAAWMGVLSPWEIAARLAGEIDGPESTGLHLLETDAPGLPKRQRSMRAVFEQAWRLLSPAERRVLAAISLFRGSFSYDAARSVSGVTLRQIRGYVDSSLLQRCGDGRYEMHELLRQYAAEQLEVESGKAIAVRDRFARFFAEEIQRQGNALLGAEQLAAIQTMDADADNLRTAWAWMVERGHVELINQAMDGLFRFYDWRGYLQTADEICRLTKSRIEQTSFQRIDFLLARLLTWHGRFLRLLGRIESAYSLLVQARAMIERRDQKSPEEINALAAVLDELGMTQEETNREDAQHLYRQSLSLYRKADNRSGMVMTLRHLGVLARNMGEYDEAHSLLEESVSISRELGDRRQTAVALDSLASVYGLLGRLEQGEALTLEAVAIHQEAGDRNRACMSLIEWASQMAYTGRYRRALELFDEAAAGFQELGALLRYVVAVQLSGWMKMNLGCYTEVAAQYEMVKDICTAAGDRHGQGLSILGLGELSLVFDRHDVAQSDLAEAATIFRELIQWDEYAIVLSDLALAQRNLDDRDGAWISVCEALKIAQRIGAFAPAHMAIDACSLLLADAGEVERAIEYHALVMAHPYFCNSAFRRKVTGEVIEKYASQVSSDRVSAAEERGRRRDVWATVDEIVAAKANQEM